MDKDVAAIRIDALFVVIGYNAVVVFGYNVVHVFALATVVMNGCRVDNLVVILAVFVAGKGGGCYVDVGDGGARIRFYSKSFDYVQGVGGGEGILLGCFAHSVLADIHIGDEHYFTVDA